MRDIVKAGPSQQSRGALCIDLSCLKANFAPGVSEPNAVFGLTAEKLEQQIL